MITVLRKHERAFIILGAALFLFLTASFPLAAQENLGRGRITGTVVDEGGNPIEGAHVVAESMQSHAKLEGTSDKKGHFAIAGLGTGGWRITASKSGYVDATSDMNVRQLVVNPPVTLTLKKLTGMAAFLQDKAASELFDQGNQLITEGKFDEAIRIFEEFLTKYPEIYQTHLNIGSCYLKKEDLEKAASEFQLVLDKTLQTLGSYKRDTAGSIRALSGLGEIALKKDDFASAQKYFTQALEVSPEDEVAAYNVGEIFFSNQKIDEAIKYFELAIQIKKDWSKAYYKLGVVYLNKGDFAKSLEYLNKFIQMDPESPEAAQAKNMIAAIEKIKK
jgi:tetratricopeptide (TPR) repeat protein